MLAKYFAVVLCGYVLDFSIYALLIYFDWPIYKANFFGFIVGVFINVILIRIFVFPDSRFSIGIDLGLSVLALGLMFIVGMLILWILVDVFGFHPYGSKLFANGLTFMLNYIFRLVFFSLK